MDVLQLPTVAVARSRQEKSLGGARRRPQNSRLSIKSFDISPFAWASFDCAAVSSIEGGGKACVGGDGVGENGKGWIHFVGVGGCGLSALAMFALKQGFEVSGSDIAWSGYMSRLHEAGARLFVGHSVSNIPRNGCLSRPCACVISSAIPADNVEVIHARSLGIPIYKRDRWLGKITEPYKLISISGTHGKSTTAAMISYVLSSMGHDISAVVGANVPQFPYGNIFSGGGPEFVLEADEYDGCFLGISPLIAVITNIEWEHVDCFKDEEAVMKMYRRFLYRIKNGGHLVLCGDSAGARSLLNGSSCMTQFGTTAEYSNPDYYITTYGIHKTNEWCAASVRSNVEGGMDYSLCHWEQPVANVSLQLHGMHNVLNSLAAIVTVITMLRKRLALDEILDTVLYHLCKFKGVSRRFEMIGKVHECYVFDDYAHHPTEIRAALQEARGRFPCKELWVIFQPHTFSRLATMLKDFASALCSADHVIVTEVYASREINTWNVGGKDLASIIRGPSCQYIPCLEDVVDKLLFELSSRHTQEIIILTLGAGDVTIVGRQLFDRLKCQP